MQRDYLALSFPRYDEPSSALIKMYLGGEFGSDPDDVNAYAASSFYAVDRYASFKAHWKNDYDSGKLIILDRFSGSNAIHQGAKFESRSNRENFFQWLENYENNLLGLPTPDKTLFFRVSPIEAVTRITSRGGVLDIHETDYNYIESCAETAEHAAEYFGWTVIDASKTQDEISGEVLRIVTSNT
jgi:dTMP kinase